MQINGVAEEENNCQNINIGHNSITNNTNPTQANQTVENNNIKVSSEKLSLNNAENGIYDDYYPGQMNIEFNKGGLESYDDFLNFLGKATININFIKLKIQKLIMSHL